MIIKKASRSLKNNGSQVRSYRGAGNKKALHMLSH